LPEIKYHNLISVSYLEDHACIREDFRAVLDAACKFTNYILATTPQTSFIIQSKRHFLRGLITNRKILWYIWI